MMKEHDYHQVGIQLRQLNEMRSLMQTHEIYPYLKIQVSSAQLKDGLLALSPAEPEFEAISSAVMSVLRRRIDALESRLRSLGVAIDEGPTGMPAQPGTPETDADPANPNARAAA